MKKKNEPGLIVNVDFEKAFDSIEWPYMIKVLKYLNFGNSFIPWTKTSIETYHAAS